jgi:tetratricopeptide (TPR) repeat protein
MRTLCTRLSALFPLLGITALILLASGCSHNKSAETAEKFYSDAQTAIAQGRYGDAEHFITASLALFQQAELPEKYNDVTVSLAGLERRRGKLSRAIAHYTNAVAYYRQSQNTGRMIPVLNELADLYAVTGCRDSAALMSSLALNTSATSGNEQMKAASEYERGRIELMFNAPYDAIVRFTNAERFPSTLSNPLLSYEVALFHGEALARLNRKDEALQRLLAADQFASMSGDGLAALHAKAALGAAYLQFGLFENAMRAFNAGLLIDSLSHPAGRDGMATQFLCGLGEVYLANYAHAIAQGFFSRALDRARAEDNTAVIGYCIARIADCVSQAAMPAPTGAAILQAAALYQQAFTVFENDLHPQRKSLMLMKEASLRAALHEDVDADRLFKMAFEQMRTASVTSEVYSEPFIITSDSRLLPLNAAVNDWWYRPYAAFLIHKRRIGDALATVTDGVAVTGRAELLRYPLEFQDTTRNERIRSFIFLLRQNELAEYELLQQQSIARVFVDEADNDVLQSKYKAQRDEAINDGEDIAARYPSLLPLVITPALHIETIQKRVTDEVSVLSYLALDDRLYAVVIAQKSGPVAVDLGPSNEIIARINEYCSLMSAQMKRPAETKENNVQLQQASLRLAADLVLPIERYITHTVIVHATKEIDRLPVHALLLQTGHPVSDSYNISYAPFLGAPSGQADLRPLKGVVIFGSPSSRPIESEYALRSIKNFYRDATLYVTQSATQKNFLWASGGLFHLSTSYGFDYEARRVTLALSGGSLTSTDVYVPISYFLMARPFRSWLIADQRQDTCAVTLEHAAFALMSGATQVVLQRYPCAATYGKDFNENFYTALTTSGDMAKAYAETLKQIQKVQERNKVYSGAGFFLIEW